jgi:succinate dehydrogenase / fumarate reductase, cytochrome b subunit
MGLFVGESKSVAQGGGQAAQRAMALTPNRLTLFWDSAIGKKIVMAVTGVVLVAFVIAHMLGNLKIFEGPAEINAYSLFLRTVGEPELNYGNLLWIVRIVLLTCVTLHIIAAYQLTRMNWNARPVGYQSKRDVETSFAALTMRWGGVLLAIFIVFHIAHFTLGAVGFKPGQYQDLHVYENVVAGFSVWPVAVFYIVAMGALCLHLDHGIWSMLQTLGWSTSRNARTLKTLSRVVAIIVFAGFVSVPVAVMTGLVH